MRLAFLLILFIMTWLPTGVLAQETLSGVYRSSDCADFSPNCFQYRFHEDGTFSYWYSTDVFGDFFISGNYYILDDMLKLTPDKYIFTDTTHINYTPRRSRDSITIRISLLPGHFKNMPDTMHVPWLIKVNNQRMFSDTDDDGVYTVAADSVYSIAIKEYSAKFQMDSEIPEADTVISPALKSHDIDIYLASSVIAPFVIRPVTLFRIHSKGKWLESLEPMQSGYWKHTTKVYVK